MMTEPIYEKNSPCKIFWFLKRSLQNILVLEIVPLVLKIVPPGTISKTKIFCRDQKQKKYFGTISTT